MIKPITHGPRSLHLPYINTMRRGISETLLVYDLH